MKIYLSVVLDCIFTFLLANIVITFLLYFCNLQANIRIISVLLSLSITFPIFFIAKSKKQKKLQKTLNEKNQQKVLYQLNFLTKKQVETLFTTAFTNYKQPFVIKNKLIYLTQKNAFVTHIFSFENITCDMLINHIKSLNVGKKTLYVFTNCTKSTPQVLNNLPFVKYFNGNYLYTFLQKANALPNITTTIKNETFLNKILNNVLKKQNTFKYIFYALILYFIAFFTPFKLYYAISGSIFLTLFIFTFIFNIKKSAPLNDAELFNN